VRGGARSVDRLFFDPLNQSLANPIGDSSKIFYSIRQL
jgi:hypothetical protein